MGLALGLLLMLQQPIIVDGHIDTPQRMLDEHADLSGRLPDGQRAVRAKSTAKVVAAAVEAAAAAAVAARARATTHRAPSRIPPRRRRPRRPSRPRHRSMRARASGRA